MTTNIDLSSGGFVAVILPPKQTVPKDIGTHPNVTMIDASERWEHGPPLPPNTKAVVFTTEGIDLARQRTIIETATRGDMLYVSRRFPQQFTETVRSWLRTAPSAAASNGEGGRQMAPKGAIAELIAANPLDPSKSNAEEARRLHEIAKRQGLTTTHASLAQAISHHRRAKGLSSKPESLVAKDVAERLAVLRTFDDAIAGLQLTRDYIAKAEVELEELRAFKRRILDLASPAA